VDEGSAEKKGKSWKYSEDLPSVGSLGEGESRGENRAREETTTKREGEKESYGCSRRGQAPVEQDTANSKKSFRIRGEEGHERFSSMPPRNQPNSVDS